MRFLVTTIVIMLSTVLKAQTFSGVLVMDDGSEPQLNIIYITNLRTQKTVLSDYKGAFSIEVQLGDVVRFTSIVTERSDVMVSQKLLKNPNNIIPLPWAYHNIPEVQLSRFKPSGNLQKDVLALENKKSALAIKKILGLPEPKGDGTPPEQPPMALANGGLTFNIGTIYDLITGEQKKKERLYAYEKMLATTSAIRNYYGDNYFLSLKIPKHYIADFLQFVYSSERLAPLVENNQFEAVKVYLEKYLPVYQKRLKNNAMMTVD